MLENPLGSQVPTSHFISSKALAQSENFGNATQSRSDDDDQLTNALSFYDDSVDSYSFTRY